MDTNKEKLLLKEEVFQIVGCALEVLNTLGHEIIEKPYENALAVEFTLRRFLFDNNLHFRWCTKVRKSVCLFLT